MYAKRVRLLLSAFNRRTLLIFRIMGEPGQQPIINPMMRLSIIIAAAAGQTLIAKLVELFPFSLYPHYTRVCMDIIRLLSCIRNRDCPRSIW